LASVLWTCGASLLHSGVVINNREYAFGGHDKRNQTGVYWTKPRTEPPGGTFKMSILHGFTFSTSTEIDQIIREASEEFQGTSYNLLSRNCNHFTSYLCEKLTGRKGPGWLNRAASIGVAMPCVVPKEWIAPPEYDDMDGELLEEEAHERSRMLTMESEGGHYLVEDGSTDDCWDSEEERRRGGNGKGKRVVKDTSGRIVPPAERAPV
jgi:hypothetical protein